MLNDKELATYLSEFKKGIISARDLLFDNNFTKEDKKWFAVKIEEHISEQDSFERHLGVYEPNLDIIDQPQEVIRTWGTPELDNVFPPIDDHHFIVLAGKQGDGKTAFTSFLAEQNAKNMRVEYITLEMTRDDILTRMARDYAGITIPEWRDRSIIPEIKKKAYKKRKKELKEKKNLQITGLAGQSKTAKDICQYLETVKPHLAIIDNLGLIDRKQGEGELDQQMTATKTMLEFCKEKRIPVILVHHLSKAGDVRGSEKIKDNATTLVLLKRTYQPSDDIEFSQAEIAETKLILSKDRDFGNICSHEIYFDKGKFKDNF